MGTIEDVMVSTRDLQFVSNNTICIPFEVAVFIDSSKAINLTSKTVSAESKKLDYQAEVVPKSL